jgi:uncharacterized protein (DUF2062 family)
MQSAITSKFTNSKAFKFIRQIFSKKTLQNIIDQLNDPGQSDGLKAFSAAVGIFVGIIPVWGLQTVLAIFLAVIFKLNKVLVVLFSQISLPPLLPLFIFLSYRVGTIWTGALPEVEDKAKSSLHNINAHLTQYLSGSVTLALVLAVLIGAATYVTLKLLKAIKRYQLTTRYRSAS